jgi:hypothetical protein
MQFKMKDMLEPAVTSDRVALLQRLCSAIRLTSARTALLQTLFRAIHSYSATSSLAFLSTVAQDDLQPLFRVRTDSMLDALASRFQHDENTSGQILMLREHTHPVIKHVDVTTVAGVQNAIAAACLVFSHTLADIAVADLCSIAAEFDTAYWTKTISNRTFTLDTIIKRGLDDLIRENIRQKIKAMSLPKKMKHLLHNAGKHSNVYYPHFWYDKERLTKLDACRHAIIHHEGITLNDEDTKDSQEFFFNTTVYAGLVVSSMLGLGVTYPNLYSDWYKHISSGLS